MSLSDLFDRVGLTASDTNQVLQSVGASAIGAWPHLAKLAAPTIEGAIPGLLRRRKAKVRGFYTDPAPGIYDLKSAFHQAARNEGAKLAAAKFLHGKDDPVQSLTRLYKRENFGLARRTPNREDDRRRSNGFGPLLGRPAHSTAQSVVHGGGSEPYTGV